MVKTSIWNVAFEMHNTYCAETKRRLADQRRAEDDATHRDAEGDEGDYSGGDYTQVPSEDDE